MINLFFFKTVLYIAVLFSVFNVLRQFSFSRILRPVIIGISFIIFSYGLFQKYYIFPKIISNFIKSENYFSQALYERVSSGRVFSIFVLPTLYGFICAVLIISLFYFLRKSFAKDREEKTVFFLLLFLLIIGIYNLILTQSFGAIIYLSIGLLVYLIIDRTIDVKYISLIVMTMFLVIFIVVGLRYKEAKNLEPVKLRLSNWNQALRMIGANPFFGVGLGNYGAQVSYYTKSGEARSIYAHNFFLQLTAETGIPFIGFLILLIIINRKKIIPDYREKSLYVSVFIMLFLYNIIDIGLYFFSTGIVFSIILSQIYIKRPKKVGLKVFMLILCSITYSALILSDDYRSEANILLNINERPGAKTLYEKSLLLNPFNFTAMLGKASALHEGINSKKGLELIERSLKIFPEYEAALFNKSIINYKNGHLLTAFYYAGVAFKKNRMNKQYREWYEFVKKNLPSRNTIKRD